MYENRTVLTIVLDSMGKERFEHDLSMYSGSLDLGALSELGLGYILNTKYHGRIPLNRHAQFAYTVKQASRSPGSEIGHQEMVGVINSEEYDLFPNGFPQEYLDALSEATGYDFICNQMYDGTQVIEDYDEQHENYEKLHWKKAIVVYGSKCDPLSQWAGRIDVIPVEKLNSVVDISFEIAPKYGVKITRAIARPYEKLENGKLNRLGKLRHDKALAVRQDTLLHVLYDHGIHTVSVGKPIDLINLELKNPEAWCRHIKETKLDPSLDLRFVDDKDYEDTNPFTEQGIFKALKEANERGGLTYMMANLVDFDSLFGHSIKGDGTENAENTLKSAEEVSRCLSMIYPLMKQGDILMLTADHGIEIRHLGTPDVYGYHSINRLPLLAKEIGGDMKEFYLGSDRTLAAVGHLAAQAFGLEDEFVERCGLQKYFSSK